MISILHESSPNSPHSDGKPKIVLHRQSIFPKAPVRPTNSMLEEVKARLLKDNISNEDATFIYSVFKTNKLLSHLRNTADSLVRDNMFIPLFQNARLTNFGAGTVIYKEGSANDGKFYFILSGEISLVKKHQESTPSNSSAHSGRPIIPIDKLASHYAYEQLGGKVRETPHSKFASTKSRQNSILFQLTPKLERTPVLKKNPSFKSGLTLSASPSKTPSRKESMIFSPNENLKGEKILKNMDTLDMREKSSKVTRLGSNFYGVNKGKKVDVIEAMIMKYGDIVDRVIDGGSFGECAFEKAGRRLMTAVTQTNTDVMELSKEYIEQFIEAFNKKREKLTGFLIKVLPAIDSVYAIQTLENLLFTLEEKVLNYNEFFLKEGEYGDSLFILYNGSCQLSKTVIYNDAEKMKQPLEECKDVYGLKQSNLENVNICTLEKGSFIGEEILFNKTKRYEYNVQVISAQATFLTISKQKFSRFPQGVYTGIKKLYNIKSEKNKEIFKKMLQTKSIEFKEDSIENLTPLIVSSTGKISYRPSIHSKDTGSFNKTFSGIERLIKSGSEPNVKVNWNKSFQDEIPRIEKQRGSLIVLKKENDEASMERFIHNLHRLSDSTRIEPFDTRDETNIIENLLNQETSSKRSKTTSKDRKSLTLKKILSSQILNEEKVSKTIQSMIKQNKSDGTSQGRISLRLGGTRNIMKVDQCYSLMKSMMQNEEKSRIEEKSSTKLLDEPGFTVDDFEADASRQKRLKRQKELILANKLKDIQSFSPSKSQDSSKALYSSFIKKRYEKVKSRKSPKFASVGSFIQLQSSSGENFFSLNNLKNSSLQKIPSNFKGSVSASLRDPISTKISSRITTSLTNSPIKPYSMWSDSSERQLIPSGCIDETVRETVITIEEKMEKRKIKKIPLGELLDGKVYKSLQSSPVQSPKRKRGSIPRRIGGFISSSFAVIKNNEGKN